jgi:hypothetical protein
LSRTKRGHDAVSCACDVCQASFQVKYARFIKGRVRFCSRACFARHKTTLTGPRAAGYRGGPSGRFTCEWCGVAGVSRKVKRQTRFCSMACYNAAKPARLVGPRNPMWQGGRYANQTGYVLVHCPKHPRAVGGKVYEHTLVAERALGRLLPKGAVVHHVNERKDDNRGCNLVIVQSRSYHMELHARLRAFRRAAQAVA